MSLYGRIEHVAVERVVIGGTGLGGCEPPGKNGSRQSHVFCGILSVGMNSYTDIKGLA